MLCICASFPLILSISATEAKCNQQHTDTCLNHCNKPGLTLGTVRWSAACLSWTCNGHRLTAGSWVWCPTGEWPALVHSPLHTNKDSQWQLSLNTPAVLKLETHIMVISQSCGTLCNGIFTTMLKTAQWCYYNPVENCTMVLLQPCGKLHIMILSQSCGKWHIKVLSPSCCKLHTLVLS